MSKSRIPRHTHFVPLPTKSAGPLLAAAQQRVKKAEASHKGRGAARKSLIHLTARHLAFQLAMEKRNCTAQAAAPLLDLFEGTP
jgi:hypothetical protein